MKKQLQAALVVEGNTTESEILRLPALAAELGPVKSVSLQVARRISNFLGAGYGVNTYEELEPAALILLRLPETELPRVVQEICRSELAIGGKSFILCESWLDNDMLKPLADRGCAVASVTASGPHTEPSFAVEGHKTAVRKLKKLILRSGVRAIELSPGTKPLFFAANLMVTALPVPLFHLATQTLRESGLTGRDLAALMQEWSDNLADGVRKGNRAPWGGPLTECSDDVSRDYFRKLMIHDSDLASTVEEWLALAKRTMAQYAKAAARARGQSA